MFKIPVSCLLLPSVLIYFYYFKNILTLEIITYFQPKKQKLARTVLYLHKLQVSVEFSILFLYIFNKKIGASKFDALKVNLLLELKF